MIQSLWRHVCECLSYLSDIRRDKIDVNISIYCNENADLEVTAHALGMKNTVFISQQTNRLTEEEIAEMIELAEKFKVEDYNKN